MHSNGLFAFFPLLPAISEPCAHCHQLFGLGNAMLDRVEGPHLTFVDPRRHNNRPGMIHNARRLVSLFEGKGIDRSQIVVSVSRTNCLIRRSDTEYQARSRRLRRVLRLQEISINITASIQIFIWSRGSYMRQRVRKLVPRLSASPLTEWVNSCGAVPTRRIC
jgi:hypothetical protein